MRKTGQPDIWDEIFNLYRNLKYREDLVNVLPGNKLSAIEYKYINYDDEMIAAKKKAVKLATGLAASPGAAVGKIVFTGKFSFRVAEARLKVISPFDPTTNCEKLFPK